MTALSDLDMCKCHLANMDYQHELLFLHSLRGSFFTELGLSWDGTLIFYILHITLHITLCMIVTRTFPRMFISNSLFLKKVANEPENSPFLQICFSSWLLLRSMQWRNHVMITKNICWWHTSENLVTKLHSIKMCMDNADNVKVSGIWLKIKRCQ